MKRLLSTLLIICCIFSLTGCEAAEKVAEIELPPVPTAEYELHEQAPQTNLTETEHQHIVINIQRTELEAHDPQEGNELILSFSYETPFVHIPANTAAEDAINEFIAMLDESYYTGNDYGVVYDSGCAPGYSNMLTMAEDNYNYIVNEGIESLNYELACHRSLGIERCDENVLSLRYYDYVNLGGVHGSYAYRSYNFDTVSGELLTLENIATDSQAFKSFLKSYMIDAVANSEELQQRMAGFVDAEGMPSKEDALGALVRDGSWCMDNKGLLIVSDLYELGSYAAGTMEFLVPYSVLEAYVKPEYMPEERAETASFAVVPVEALSESSREIIDMVKVHDDGQGVYLVSDGIARNVRITKGVYSEQFYETSQLWYCSIMDNCAVQLVTRIPEGMPDLKISYADQNGEHSFYVSQSGVDGSIILVDDSIEAVG